MLDLMRKVIYENRMKGEKREMKADRDRMEERKEESIKEEEGDGEGG